MLWRRAVEQTRQQLFRDASWSFLALLYRTTEALPFSQNSSFGHTVTVCYYLAERLRQHLGHGEEADEEAVHKKWDQRGNREG